MLELEGTWEEIVAHAAELAGHRVRLIVLSAAGGGQAEDGTPPAERFAAALRELEAMDPEMRFTPGDDTQAYIREARAGAMYGDEAPVAGFSRVTPEKGGAVGRGRDPELVARVKSIRGKFARTGGGLASEALHHERQVDKEKEEQQVQRNQA
jgi:hypothetical protein